MSKIEFRSIPLHQYHHRQYLYGLIFWRNFLMWTSKVISQKKFTEIKISFKMFTPPSPSQPVFERKSTWVFHFFGWPLINWVPSNLTSNIKRI